MTRVLNWLWSIGRSARSSGLVAWLAGTLAIAGGAITEAAPPSSPKSSFHRVDYAAGDWRFTETLCTPKQVKAKQASSFGCYRGYTSAPYNSFVRSSTYLPMRDGVRLAVDVYRPAIDGKVADAPLPVVFTFSRYWRATELPNGQVRTSAGVLNQGQQGDLLDISLGRDPRGDREGVGLLLAHGYVFVRAESRGAGASFGIRQGDMSGVEALDGRDVLDWAARQPWSNGKAAMIGGSYEGMSQFLVASSAPKSLVAIMPMVATFDEYRASWSGAGVMRKYGLAWLAREARKDGVQKGLSGSTINPVDKSGDIVARVDADLDGGLRAAARQERLGDADSRDPTTYFSRQSPAAAEMTTLLRVALGDDAPAPLMETLYSTEALERLMAANPGLREKLTALRFARDDSHFLTEVQETGPNNLALLAPRVRDSGVAVYNWGGWRDFASLDTLLWDANVGPQRKLTIGPWSHSASDRSDPREAASRRLKPIEQLRWLDYWLKDKANSVMSEPAFTYAMPEDSAHFQWRTARSWKERSTVPVTFALAEDGALARRAPAAAGLVGFDVDYNTTLGGHTRYHAAIGLGPMRFGDLNSYGARGGAIFTSTAFKSQTAFLGAPIVRLKIGASTPDADVHAVLFKVSASGEATYLTDGLMRASHRALGAAPYDNLGLPFSDSRRDTVSKTAPLRSDQLTELVFDLQPVGVIFAPGERLRLVVTGADADTNLTIPQSPATHLKIGIGKPQASTLTLDRLP